MTASAAGGTELYLIPHAEGWILYAPLAGRVVHANSACVDQIRRYLATGDEEVVDGSVTARLGGLGWLDPRPAPRPRDAAAPYRPTQVTLFLTNQCNLACTYCYAEAGAHRPRRIAPETAAAAIDVAADNAAKHGAALSVGFHGGGEPTTAWTELTAAIAHARRTADRRRLDLRLGIATNGVMSREHARVVASTFPTVTLSLDGPRDLQNEQRPRRGGGGSYDAVLRFIDALHHRDTPFVVRTTVTRRSVGRLPELVDRLHDATGCRMIHFEPAFASGRAGGDVTLVPAPWAFATGFVAAVDQAAERGVRVRYSAARLGAAYPAFCACSGDPLNVTPEGDVTACFEVCDRSAPRAGIFIFARFERDRGELVVDRDRLAHLRTLTVHHRAECRSCFARWSCAGDCPAKWRESGPDPERCAMHREIAHALLVRSLDPKRCAVI